MTTLKVHQPELTLSAETTISADTTEETCAIEKKPSAVFCKICLSGGSDEQLLIQPCTCKGNIFVFSKNNFTHFSLGDLDTVRIISIKHKKKNIYL